VPCTNILKGLPFNEFIVKFSEYICARFTSMETFFDLVNVGIGTGKLYRGISAIGKKEIKSLKQIGLITINNTDTDVEITVNETLLDTFVKAHQNNTVVTAAQGTGTTLVGNSTTVGNVVTYPIKPLTSTGGTVVVTSTATSVNLEVPPAVQSGVRTVTGVGRVVVNNIDASNPVVGLSTVDATVTSGSTNLVESGAVFTAIAAINGSETKVTAGTNVSVTGVGTTVSPYIINSTAVSGTTNIVGSSTIDVTGSGSAINPYTISANNLQKTITYPADFTSSVYTVTSNDDNYTIIVNNGTNPVSVAIPAGLVTKIGVGFIQKGTADLTYTASGTVINSANGYKSKGQYYQTFIEQEAATNTYYLLGNTKI
jgi:hypothetical protein